MRSCAFLEKRGLLICSIIFDGGNNAEFQNKQFIKSRTESDDQRCGRKYGRNSCSLNPISCEGICHSTTQAARFVEPLFTQLIEMLAAVFVQSKIFSPAVHPCTCCHRRQFCIYAQSPIGDIPFQLKIPFPPENLINMASC